MPFYNFDGIEIIRMSFGSSQLHFRVKAFSDGLQNFIIINRSFINWVA
jgi:hypothetical protein